MLLPELLGRLAVGTSQGEFVELPARLEEALLAQGSSAQLRAAMVEPPPQAGPGAVQWASEAPRTCASAYLELCASTPSGRAKSRALLPLGRQYRRADMRRLLVEATNGSGAAVILHSDTLPLATVLWPGSTVVSPGTAVVRCENPVCSARRVERLVTLPSLVHVAVGAGEARVPVLPCPSCPNPSVSAWGRNWVRVPAAAEATRLPSLRYPVPPEALRRVHGVGSVHLAFGAPPNPTWGAVWNPETLRSAPKSTGRLRPGASCGAAFAALRDGAGAGVSLAWTLDNDNLRALVTHCRGLPAARRLEATKALAHVFQPRRAVNYRTDYDAGTGDSTHYPYIAFDADRFAELIRFAGYIDSPGRFLDVGCGVGEKPFLAYALGAFTQCDGIEFNTDTVAVANYLFGMISSSSPYPIRVFPADAFVFDRYAEYDFVYMYRPLRDRSMMHALFRTITSKMAVGAVVVDAINSELALKKLGGGSFATYDPASTERAKWTVPVENLDEFLALHGLWPAEA